MSFWPEEPAPRRWEATGRSKAVTSDRISDSDDFSLWLVRLDSGKLSGV
jgi:hypothetical protein